MVQRKGVQRMEKPLSPTISSFVIRFVQDEAEAKAVETGPAHMPYRGTIRHVQTDQEVSFTRWEDAVSFIQRFIRLEQPQEPHYPELKKGE